MLLHYVWGYAALRNCSAEARGPYQAWHMSDQLIYKYVEQVFYRSSTSSMSNIIHLHPSSRFQSAGLDTCRRWRCVLLARRCFRSSAWRCSEGAPLPQSMYIEAVHSTEHRERMGWSRMCRIGTAEKWERWERELTESWKLRRLDYVGLEEEESWKICEVLELLELLEALEVLGVFKLYLWSICDVAQVAQVAQVGNLWCLWCLDCLVSMPRRSHWVSFWLSYYAFITTHRHSFSLA